MNEKLLDFVKTVGVPAALACALAGLLYMELKNAEAERVSHTAILIDQMSALRHACDPRAP